MLGFDLNKLKLLKLKKDKKKSEMPCFYQKLVGMSFYRGICLDQVLACHDKALEEFAYVIQRMDQLPEHLLQSKYFEFLLNSMKQTTFDNMRKQSQQDELLTVKEHLTPLVTSHSEPANQCAQPQTDTLIVSMQSSEAAVQSSKSRGSSKQNSRQNSPSKVSSHAESASQNAEQSENPASESDVGVKGYGPNQVGMFGRFRRVFGRVKDEALGVGKAEPQIIVESQQESTQHPEQSKSDQASSYSESQEAKSEPQQVVPPPPPPKAVPKQRPRPMVRGQLPRPARPPTQIRPPLNQKPIPNKEQPKPEQVQKPTPSDNPFATTAAKPKIEGQKRAQSKYAALY